MQASAGKPISDMRQNENKNEAESVWLGAQVIIGGNAKFRFEDASLYRMVAGAGYFPTLLSPDLPLGLTLTLASCFERLTSPFHIHIDRGAFLWFFHFLTQLCVAAKHTQLGLFENGTVRPAPFRRPRGRPRTNAASSGALRGMVWGG